MLSFQPFCHLIEKRRQDAENKIAGDEPVASRQDRNAGLDQILDTEIAECHSADHREEDHHQV